MRLEIKQEVPAVDLVLRADNDGVSLVDTISGQIILVVMEEGYIYMPNVYERSGIALQINYTHEDGGPVVVKDLKSMGLECVCKTKSI